MPLKRPTGTSLAVNISGPAKFGVSDDGEKNETDELKHEVRTQTEPEVQKRRPTFCNKIPLLN